MSTITFDTHQLVKDLESRGFNTSQAEGINDALKSALTIAEVATKHDLKEMELRLTLKIGSLLAASVAFAVAAQKLF
jgi:hypothetical protein